MKKLLFLLFITSNLVNANPLESHKNETHYPSIPEGRLAAVEAQKALSVPINNYSCDPNNTEYVCVNLNSSSGTGIKPFAICKYAGVWYPLYEVYPDSPNENSSFCPATFQEEFCGESGEHAYNGTGDATTYCADGCELTYGGSGLTSDSNGTLWGSWTYTGETCDASYPGGENPDTPDDNCATFSGETVCLDEATPNCGEFNGELVCVDSIPDGDCTLLSQGSMLCFEEAGTPPAPDVGVVGQEAPPTIILNSSDNETIHYHNNTTVNNSTTTNPNNDTGNSDIAQFCRDNPNAMICDSTGTPQNTDVDVTVEINESAIGDAVAESLGCVGDECQNIDTGTASEFSDSSTVIDDARQEFLDAFDQAKLDINAAIDLTISQGATMEAFTWPIPGHGDVASDMTVFQQILSMLGLVLVFVAFFNAIGIIMP